MKDLCSELLAPRMEGSRFYFDSAPASRPMLPPRPRCEHKSLPPPRELPPSAWQPGRAPATVAPVAAFSLRSLPMEWIAQKSKVLVYHQNGPIPKND